MVLFAATTTPRLQHIAAWLGNYLLGQPMQIITDEKELVENDLVINYSHQVLPFNSFHLQPYELLFEKGLRPQNIEIKQHHNLPCFFATAGDFTFDILAASFYLMQRYEEYLPHQKDQYGRYAHTNSVAFNNEFLHLPLIDLWMQHLKEALQKKFSSSALQFTEHRFQLIPTYDVDIAYNYRGKGLLRNVGGLFRSVFKLQLRNCIAQISVLLTGKKDPFDVFEELNALHTEYELSPVYFFLLAQKQKGADKNINPKKEIYQKLIQKLSSQYKTGIHLSAAASHSPATMQSEKGVLEKITRQKVVANRSHYLLFTLPQTYQLLQKDPLLITEEYSMGYGTINGFRASICTPYYWYNLHTEESTALHIFPFCYMEANSIFQLKHTPQQALEEMKQFYEITKQVDGLFITIFHNHLIGKDANGQQWMNMYQQFLKELK